MWSTVEPLTNAQKKQLQSHIGGLYEMFLDTVADGRKVPRERVDAIAEGRVWTGAQALDLHLIDAIGGYEDAFDAVRDLAHLPPNTPITVIFPRTGTFLQAVRSHLPTFGVTLPPARAEIGALRNLADVLQSLRTSGAAEMAPIRIF